MKLAVVGITGMVGQEMIDVLEEMNFQIDEFIPVASERSIGKMIEYNGSKYEVISMEDAVKLKPNIAIFSAGGSVSLEWAPKFAEVGTTVIDNSSAWRMDETKKLIIPEINGDILTKDDKIIANPNCSTIQMLMALYPIQKKYGITRIVVSTYQSITGTGIKAVNQLENEYKGESGDMAYNYQIHQNAIPHCDDFLENGYTKEEMKLVNETNKIFNSEISITATAVRIPVMGGHSESVNITLENPFNLKELVDELKSFNGLEVKDDPASNLYPMPFFSRGSNNVYVGRIRKDFSCENSLNLWVVADNLRKGAATNAVQIAKLIVKNNLV
ncbi:MAG: aspartate-semialdehyde dehydrogenase [Flavobacteriaceae bacterium]|jgi:aspartate-semialdehyde dehydrogenase